MMNWAQEITRRKLLTASPLSIGSLGLESLLGSNEKFSLIGGAAPKAKRVIYLFMSGGPSHVDTFDPKPLLNKRDGEKVPAEIVRNHEFAMIKE